MIGEKFTCTACSREFTRIRGDEQICAVCADPEGYALTCTLDEIDGKIREVEDRQSRADTNEAATADAYTLQELQAARQIVADGVGKLGRNVSFLGFPT